VGVDAHAGASRQAQGLDAAGAGREVALRILGVEAMLDGVIAAVLALFVGYLTIFVGGPKLISFIDLTDTLNFFQSHWTLVGLITMASGMLIGTISSTLAMIRYLKL